MRLLILLMLFSGTVNAITVNQLIEKYGKSKITEFISNKTKGKLSVYVNGQLKKKHMPSLDYVSAMTINRDLVSIRLTPNQIDKLFTEKEREKKRHLKLRKKKRYSSNTGSI